MDANQHLKLMIGDLVFANAEQRARLEQQAAEKVTASESTSCAYELLAACIRSGQLDSKQVDEAMADEVFAAWYAKRFA